MAKKIPHARAPQELWLAVEKLSKQWGVLKIIDALAVVCDRSTDRAYNDGYGDTGNGYLKLRDKLDRLNIASPAAVKWIEEKQGERD